MHYARHVPWAQATADQDNKSLLSLLFGQFFSIDHTGQLKRLNPFKVRWFPGLTLVPLDRSTDSYHVESIVLPSCRDR